VKKEEGKEVVGEVNQCGDEFVLVDEFDAITLTPEEDVILSQKHKFELRIINDHFQ
jgi:hypothetical protein